MDKPASEAKSASFIPVAKPFIDDRELEAVRRPIQSGWLTQGPEVAAFEKEFAAYVGASHACAVSNCTTALHLALLTVGIKPGDEVITVSHSYIATPNSVRYCGATPVFVDIKPGTFNLNPDLIENAITKKTRAILAVHQMGMPCDLNAILKTARKHELPVIEDAACAIGSEIRVGESWEKVGRPQGDIACFSFHPRKVLTTGDGGMLTTSNSQWDKQFRLLRQHGMNVPDRVRHTAKEVIFEDYALLGFNYRLTDIQAAIGREQIKKLPKIIQERRRLAENYQTLLSEIQGLGIPEEKSWAKSNWQSYCVRLPEGCDQKKVMTHMLEHEIATRRGIMCSHREPAYPEGTYRSEGLTESEKAQDHCILLPFFVPMDSSDQERVVQVLKQACS